MMMIEQAGRDLPTTIELGGGRIGFMEIYNRFAVSRLGERLGKKVRFDRYRPKGDTSEVGVSEAEWVRRLGADVDNLRHGKLTYGIARLFLSPPPTTECLKTRRIDVLLPGLNKREQEIVLLAAVVHDFAEGVTGDTTHDEKTEEKRRRETEITGSILDELGLGSFSLEIKQILENKESKLGRVFAAIERVGFLRTALLAYRQTLKIKTEEEPREKLVNGLAWLVENVFSNQIEELLEDAKNFPQTRFFLLEKRDLISAAFANLPDGVFLNYEEGKREDRKRKFNSAKIAWSKFIDAERAKRNSSLDFSSAH